MPTIPRSEFNEPHSFALTLLRHREFVARTQPPAPTLAEIDKAHAATLRLLAQQLDETPDVAHAGLLATFSNPSWQDLHSEEASQIDAIAEDAARRIFGESTRDRLTPRLAEDLEQGATYLVRRIHPEFVQAAQDQAVATLLASDEFIALLSGRSRSMGELQVIAHRMVMSVRAAYHGVMEATVPLRPAVYLRASAGAVERGAR